MAITEGAICAVSGAAGSLGSVTSASFDSTGAGGYLFFVAHEGTPTTYTWTDSKSTASGNFVSLGTVNLTVGTGANDLSMHCMFCWTPSVGTGHTVTVTFDAARPHRYIGGVCLNGTFSSTFLSATTQTNQNASLTATVDAGSLVTDAAAYLIQFGANYNGIAGSAAGSGWAFKSNASAGRQFQARNEATASTYDPVYTLTATADWVTLASAIKETAGGAVFKPRAMLLGVG